MAETPTQPTVPEPAPSRHQDSWLRWAPRAAVAWSLLYAAPGGYWLLGGAGFPYSPGAADAVGAPLMAAAEPGLSRAAVAALGLPAALLGAVMLRRPGTGRPLLLAAGVLVCAVLLLSMVGITPLLALGYLPYAVLGAVTGAAPGRAYPALLAWPFPHHLFCLVGGLLWAAATVSYALRTARPGARSSTWASPASAARWGRHAVAAALVVPVYYAATRTAWALGVPWGVTEDLLREGQETGLWTSGLFLAAAALGGAVLTLGLAQRWGEVFPRWLPGLAGRRVPVPLAAVPASAAAALLVVGGAALWTGHAAAVDEAVGAGRITLGGALPVLLLPVWGVALAAATLAYVLRRREAR